MASAQPSGVGGGVIIEMVFVFMPFMLLVLGIIQIGLLEVGKIGTMRAANAAVRAAVVVLDDDPRFYGRAARKSAPAGSQRMNAIVDAAAIALVPFDPQVTTRTVANAIGSPPSATPLPALLRPSAALRRKVKITFPGKGRGRFGDEETVTVRVDYDFNCIVPLASAVMCGADGVKALREEATLTNQGAPYTY